MTAQQRIPMPMPMGWYQVAFSKDLDVATAQPLEYFEQDLVLFRTEAGEARVLDAYCPHMGAHLGYGIRDQAGGGSQIKGDSIVCPFHGWAYNGDGQCTEIPYCKNMPPKVARGDQVIRPWQVREINQTIFVWYHPENADPLWEPEHVPEADLDNDEWGELNIYTWDINTHLQEMGENAVDPAHFLYVHGTQEVPEPEVQEFEDHTRWGRLVSRMKTPKGEIVGTIENRSIGPGQSVVRFGGIVDTILLANVTPISHDRTFAQYAFLQKKVNGEEPVGGVAAALVADIRKQMSEDSIIWNHKKYFDRPMLCDGDGPFSKFRKWYSQFYAQDWTTTE